MKRVFSIIILFLILFSCDSTSGDKSIDKSSTETPGEVSDEDIIDDDNLDDDEVKPETPQKEYIRVAIFGNSTNKKDTLFNVLCDGDLFEKNYTVSSLPPFSYVLSKDIIKKNVSASLQMNRSQNGQYFKFIMIMYINGHRVNSLEMEGETITSNNWLYYDLKSEFLYGLSTGKDFEEDCRKYILTGQTASQIKLPEESSVDLIDTYYTTPEYIRIVVWCNAALKKEKAGIKVKIGNSSSYQYYGRATSFPLTIHIPPSQMPYHIQVQGTYNHSEEAATMDESMTFHVYVNKDLREYRTLVGTQMHTINNYYTYDHTFDTGYSETDYSFICPDLRYDMGNYTKEWENMTYVTIPIVNY